MASAADVMFAQLQQDESNRLLEQQRKQQSQLQKRRGRMGFGRLLGAAAGGLLGLALAPISGGASLYAALGAGLGSRAGSGIAGRTAVDDIEVGKLYQEQARDARRQGIQAQRDLIRGANAGALSDAFSAYTLAGTGLGKGVQQSIKERSFNPLKQVMNRGAYTGSAGLSIDDLNQGVVDKYGQSMIQPRPGASILDTTKIAGPPIELAGDNAITGPAVGINNAKAQAGTGELFASSPNSQTIPVGEIQGPSINLANQTALDVANNPYFGPPLPPGFQPPVGPYAPYTGTMEQNLRLAEALNLNTNRSIVDQLKRYGADSSMEARRKMFQDYFGGAY